MSLFHRGSVKVITFDVEYPDGTTKTMRIEDAEDVGIIVLRDAYVPLRDKLVFNISDSDWTQNPAMIIYRGDPESRMPQPVCAGC